MAANETQYKELSQDVRNYETRLYVTPPALLAILGWSLEYAVRRQDDLPKVVLIGFLVIVCHAFISLFAKLSIHQRSVRQALAKIEQSDETFMKVGRTSSGAGQMGDIPRIEYSKLSPLWIYFHASADNAILAMMMTAMLGVLTYFLKTVFDFFRLWPDGTVIWISIVLAVGVFIIYCAIISKPPSRVKQTGNQNTQR